MPLTRGIGALSLFDSLIHVCLFGTIGLVTFFTFPKHTLKAAWSLVIYGTYSEIIQSFIPTRTTSIRDLFNDCIGIAIALLIFVFVTRHLLKKEKVSPLAKKRKKQTSRRLAL
ncbi:MAG: VanZ family protein [bacterium]|nr:VanZ family protein [bacterium]